MTRVKPEAHISIHNSHRTSSPNSEQRKETCNRRQRFTTSKTFLRKLVVEIKRSGWTNRENQTISTWKNWQDSKRTRRYNWEEQIVDRSRTSTLQRNHCRALKALQLCYDRSHLLNQIQVHSDPDTADILKAPLPAKSDWRRLCKRFFRSMHVIFRCNFRPAYRVTFLPPKPHRTLAKLT